MLVTGAPGGGASARVTNWAADWAAVRPGATVVIQHCDADAAAGEFRLLAARLIAAFGGDYDAAADHWPTQCRPRSRARWPSNSRQAVRVGGGWPGASWQGGGTGCSCAGRDPSTS
ncbi:protein of unknown function [Micropruina glycogenica]|uniref:Uncharacterized protein n=1 Tax=Micropruina glycogenica TaxID=75385 RepID=A0A2N9JK39_9ACTN|nr:protein of unknown function [Micropruina glycogenica]